MALKDTLLELQKRQQASSTPAFDRKKALHEWIGAVEKLHDDIIPNFLASYIADGSLTLSTRMVSKREEAFGEYKISELQIHATDIIVSVSPVARIIVGGRGRVDLYRNGPGANTNRFMLLRQAQQNDPSSVLWAIRVPIDLRSGFNYDPPKVLTPGQVIPLTKESFELALECLLNTTQWPH